MTTCILQLIGCLVILSSPPAEISYTRGINHLLYLPIIAQYNLEKPPYRNTCGFSPEEEDLFLRIAFHPSQNRAELKCDGRLTEAARAKGRDMATRGYFGHTNPDGIGPHLLAVQYGFELPDSYLTPPTLNYIESLAGGTSSAKSTFNLLTNSEPHRKHLMGEGGFFSEQNRIGIGFVRQEGSSYGWYWVILIAREGG